MMDLYTIKQEMLSLLETVGICHQKYTFFQAMLCLQVYLKKRELLSSSDPYVIVMGEDPMGRLLRCSSLNMKDPHQWNKLKSLFNQHLELCRPNQVPASQEGTNSNGRGVKRKSPPIDFEEARPRSPVYIYLPPSPAYESGDETSYSIQEYPTEVAHSESDDSSSSSSKDAKDSLSAASSVSGVDSDSDVSAIAKIVKENLSDGSCLSAMECEDSASIPRQRVVTAIAETIIDKISTLLKPPSYSSDLGLDVAFWADRSAGESISEREPNQSDEWQCLKCNHLNQGGRERCEQCKIRRKRKRMLTRKRRNILKQTQDAAKERRSKTSQESCAEADSSVVAEKCIICVSMDANALIVHGQTAHNVCCYRCARKLQKEGLPNTCPACRRDIDRVVRVLK